MKIIFFNNCTWVTAYPLVAQRSKCFFPCIRRSTLLKKPFPYPSHLFGDRGSRSISISDIKFSFLSIKSLDFKAVVVFPFKVLQVRVGNSLTKKIWVLQNLFQISPFLQSRFWSVSFTSRSRILKITNE